jgi:hypothetical protein
MKPITSIKVAIKKGDPITIRLGDLFTTDSELKVINSDITHHYTALMLLTTAITRDLARKSYSRVYFTMIGTDKIAYTIARTTENSIILINPKGKETEIHKKYLIESMRKFELGETSIVYAGVRLYVCTAISRLADIAKTDIRKMEARAMDLSKWPCFSLVIWAKHHLNIPSSNIPKAKYIEDKIGTINGMLKLSATRNASIPKPVKEILIETNTDPDKVFSLFMGGVVADSRFGAIGGIKFINLRGEEVDAHGQGNLPLIHVDQGIRLNHLNMYTVVCIEKAPIWIIVPPYDEHDTPITWRLYETDELITYAKKFTKVSVHWLIDRLGVDRLRAASREGRTPVDAISYLPNDPGLQRGSYRPSSGFYTAVEHNDCRPEPEQPVKVSANFDLSRSELNTFKWGSLEAAEAFSNNTRWDEEEDGVLTEDLSETEPADNENF